ncbi:5022_t:CDS:2 [Entrophospora sp. SA101]|nr:10407_t:CDS:2 [Entrophospora sp. SA101]CAJ0872676.1 5022_t:CDS:2 [Entrophospora sp. SA101]
MALERAEDIKDAIGRTIQIIYYEIGLTGGNDDDRLPLFHRKNCEEFSNQPTPNVPPVNPQPCNPTPTNPISQQSDENNASQSNKQNEPSGEANSPATSSNTSSQSTSSSSSSSYSSSSVSDENSGSNDTPTTETATSGYDRGDSSTISEPKPKDEPTASQPAFQPEFSLSAEPTQTSTVSLQIEAIKQIDNQQIKKARQLAKETVKEYVRRQKITDYEEKELAKELEQLTTSQAVAQKVQQTINQLKQQKTQKVSPQQNSFYEQQKNGQWKTLISSLERIVEEAYPEVDFQGFKGFEEHNQRAGHCEFDASQNTQTSYTNEQNSSEKNKETDTDKSKIIQEKKRELAEKKEQLNELLKEEEEAKKELEEKIKLEKELTDKVKNAEEKLQLGELISVLNRESSKDLTSLANAYQKVVKTSPLYTTAKKSFADNDRFNKKTTRNEGNAKNNKEYLDNIYNAWSGKENQNQKPANERKALNDKLQDQKSPGTTNFPNYSP